MNEALVDRWLFSFTDGEQLCCDNHKTKSFCPSKIQSERFLHGTEMDANGLNLTQFGNEAQEDIETFWSSIWIAIVVMFYLVALLFHILIGAHIGQAALTTQRPIDFLLIVHEVILLNKY